MKIYITPSGVWAGTQDDWHAAMKLEEAEGTPADHTIEVPVKKAELMEFLNFHGFNVLHPCGTTVTAHVIQNVDTSVTPVTLDDLWSAATIAKQVELVVGLLDRLEALSRK